MKTADQMLRERAQKLSLYGLLANWENYAKEPWLEILLSIEEEERQCRSLQRRIKTARIGQFKAMADFDWDWPKKVDRFAIDQLFSFQFIEEAANIVLIGTNGVGKTMIAQNLAHQALLQGHTVRFTSASAMLNDLAAQDGSLALKRRLQFYSRPSLLVIDEVGYLSYDNRHADLLFEIVNRRYQTKSIIVTTNKVFKEWNDVFPNASCVVALIDRLIHKAEIIQLDGESYRLKEAKERAKKKTTRRRNSTKSKGTAKR